MTTGTRLFVKAIRWERGTHALRHGDTARQDVWLIGKTPLGEFKILVGGPLSAEIVRSPVGPLPRKVFDQPGAEEAAVEFVNEWYADLVRSCLEGYPDADRP